MVTILCHRLIHLQSHLLHKDQLPVLVPRSIWNQSQLHLDEHLQAMRVSFN
jgi:hypothetical protein